jgi:hypothetical protein
MIRRSGDTVCDPHHTQEEDKKRGFPSLGLKISVDVLLI